MPGVQLRGDVPEINIIGRVTAPAPLLAFRVNNHSLRVDSSGGLFDAKVPVEKPDTPVSVVAVDKTGKRASLDFVLIPESEQTRSAS
jgi:hypothetical protein